MAEQSQERLPADIAEAAAPNMECLPQGNGAAVRSLVRHISHHTGPLPDPETLEKYNRIIPNGAERIMQIAELQRAHRQAQEQRIVLTDAKLSLRGQCIGLTLAVFLGAAGWHLGLNGHDWLAGIVFATTIGGVVTTFVLGRRTDE
jgi:uncharacterized membrane protein